MSDGPLEWLYGLSAHGIKLGLANVRGLLSRLGDPQRSLRCVHVAGSDGKGSTCAMIASILGEAGMRVGLYTSPHVTRFNERIRVCGAEISDAELSALAEEAEPAVEAMAREGLQCTFFEAATALAFMHFQRRHVDIAVVEVGMGGRFDATNVVSPDVCVIANISMEHTRYLGGTIEEIAFEKAGIIKEGVPAVTCNRGPALEVVSRVAAERHAPLTVAGRPELLSADSAGISIRYGGAEYRVGIPGGYQAVNAAMAVEAARLLSPPVPEEAVARGLASARAACRMQKIEGLPLVVDVSHTCAGTAAMAAEVARIYGRVTAVLGLLSDKDAECVSRSIGSIASKVVLALPRTERAMPLAELEAHVSRHATVAGSFGDVCEAIDRAMEIRGGETVLVTGSFHMAEGAAEWLRRRTSARSWTPWPRCTAAARTPGARRTAGTRSGSRTRSTC